ncbi:TSUP family transporter [Pseudohalocynthiibacter aestuariivivens]|jgi:uncharacterized protein|uniref:Probable membrane transporter protein n=1 Tax=Pseudohalocynthiibacter aestuariivivens TaxID=1591409 RepID=A0ABV5JE07_9RHOB|nr:MULTISPECIES: sulfite exporter TauE/SafE family protein [Pseudohalocynthiibacter]MBS9718082.1 sulfite exporter TauE/SafE family protein [Pseudohalocynthiibacter aestuariivivens]MCK0103293.1 sulfite exporter TauE/SafE family protein [Pseudohalocynthiibacter sp. F2068]
MIPLLGLSITDLVWCGTVLFVASYIRGYSGFGFTAVLMSGLTISLPIIEIVPLSIALELAASSGQARGIFSDIRWKQLSILLTAGFVGTPIGVYLLGILPEDPLRISVLAFIFISSFYLIFSHKRLRTLPSLVHGLVGFAIGIANGATALSGLVLALFFSLTDEKATRMRATMIAYLFVADVWAGGFLATSGFYDGLTVHRILVSLPLLGLGVWLGSRQFASTDPKTFRAVVLWLLLILSATGLLFVTTANFP